MYANMPDEDHDATWRPEEESALVLAAQRDLSAFAPLYDRYATDIYRFAYVRLGQRQAAEDLTARVFTRAMERIAQYQPRRGATFRSWLFTIARNLLADDWRRRKNIRAIDSSDASTRDDSPGPDVLAVHRSEMDLLRSALLSLPDRQRDIVQLRMVGFTTPEIAHSLGISIAAVKSAQTRAYKTLRIALAEPKGGRS